METLRWKQSSRYSRMFFFTCRALLDYFEDSYWGSTTISMHIVFSIRVACFCSYKAELVWFVPLYVQWPLHFMCLRLLYLMAPSIGQATLSTLFSLCDWPKSQFDALQCEWSLWFSWFDLASSKSPFFCNASTLTHLKKLNAYGCKVWWSQRTYFSIIEWNVNSYTEGDTRPAITPLYLLFWHL